MKDRVFIDTNVWLYAFMEDSQGKKERALSVISKNSGNIVISTQVLIEISANLLKKTDYDEKDVSIVVERLSYVYHISLVDVQTILKALDIRKKYKYSFWDSLIIASALIAGCSTLYTEDMQHSQLIDGSLRIVNPFLGE